MKKEVLMCLAAATVAAVNAEVRTAGPFEQTAISVAEGQSVTETGPIRHDSLASGFAKDGAGAYTLPLGTVVQTTPLELSVRQGSVKLTDDGTSATVSAPACLQNAALWLDANDLAGAEGASVQTWLDHREASADQNAYPRVTQGTEAKRPTITIDDAGKKWLYFGGWASGKWGAFSKTLTVFHAYAVVKLVDKYGFVFGVTTSGISFHGGLGSTLETDAVYWNPVESSQAVMAGQTYLDGARINGGATRVKSGVQLIEWEAGNRTAPIENFWNDRNITNGGSRQGGDYLGEVVLFTKRLSSAERQQVEMYLMRKWEGSVQPSAVNVKTASGVSVELAADMAEPTVTVRGTGVAVKNTAETMHYADAVQGKSDVTWRLESGSMEFEQGATRIAFQSGDALTTVKDAYGVTTLAKSTDVAEGTASLTGGSGAYRIEAVPGGASNLTIVCGSLALGAAAASSDGAVVPSTAVPQSGVFATMDNPGFESFNGQKWLTSETTEAKWTLKPNGNGQFMVFDAGVSQQTTYMPGNPPPEGKKSMGFDFRSTTAVGATASASTSITFPQDGDYLLTFRDVPRTSGQSGDRVDFSLTDANQVTRAIVGYYSAPGVLDTEYRYDRYVVPSVKAGTYTFTIEFTHMSSGEKLTVLDDFKFQLIAADESPETVFQVPNGNLEKFALSSAATIASDSTAEDWTFVSTSGGANADVGPLGAHMTTYYIGNNATCGQCQLAFFNNTGTATTKAFAPPAGKWKLRLRGASNTAKTTSWNGVDVKGKGCVQAKVSVAGATALSLGEFVINSTEMKSFTFPESFSCSGDETIAIELKQTYAGANAVVDDLELVKDDELIVNGNFGTGAGSKEHWNTPSWTQMPNLLMDGNLFYGKTVIDGPALMISKQVSAEQEVEFSETGTYRLSFWARGRAHYASPTAELPVMNFAQNRLRFYLKKGGDETEIYRTEKLNSTNFVHYTALFPVTTAGTYTFGFQGTDTEDHNAWIDLVSVKKVSAAAAPEIPAETDLDIRLADGEKLRLDYTGSTTVHGLKVNGHRLHGEVSATTYPDYVTGPGSLTATYRPGLLLIVQ